jgi:branched-chain amino acid transport system substrate-binding protein
MSAKVVGFDPKTNDLVGALTAASAQSTTPVAPMLGAPDQCLAVAKAIDQPASTRARSRGSSARRAVLKKDYPGGDYPGGTTRLQGGLRRAAGLPQGPRRVRQTGLATDPWTPTEFLHPTIAKYMNKVGYRNLSPEKIAAAAKAFRGPIVLGPPKVQCGKYPKLPAICADGASFFRYQGHDVFTRAPGGWFETPAAIQKKNGAKAIAQ